MSEAGRWLRICLDRLEGRSVAVATDPWCRRTLHGAARRADHCGADGWLFTFGDGSRLLANNNNASVQSRETREPL